MTGTEIRKLRAVVRNIEFRLQVAARGLLIHKAPYQKGGSKCGKEYSAVDSGWIRGAADLVTALQHDHSLVINTFPEIYKRKRKIGGAFDELLKTLKSD